MQPRNTGKMVEGAEKKLLVKIKNGKTITFNVIL
jgi:hypothetical protein